MSVIWNEWCRIEGMKIPDLGKEYGVFAQLPTDTTVYYGAPEIQIYNQTSAINGIVYKVVKITELDALYDSIKMIDANYSTLQQKITTYDKTIDTSTSTNSAIYYYEPFVVEESSVIFYADSTSSVFNKCTVILIDKYATPKIITIAAKYTGNPVPVGDEVNEKDIEVLAIYADGNQVLIKEGYEVDPNDLKITTVKSNIFNIKYSDKDGTEFQSQIAVQGMKKLIGIYAIYSGPALSHHQTIQRKHITVVAKYSDNTSATVTDYTFPNGNDMTEDGKCDIYYRGFYATIEIEKYNISDSRLMAYYTGPNIEVGHNFDTTKCNIKIYYQSSDGLHSKYENVPTELCTFVPVTIEHEGINQITVSYEGELGIVSTQMIVIGIKPEVVLNFIEAEYTGPEIMVGKTYSLEKVIVKAHFSDGTITTIKNGFTVATNIVSLVGINEYQVTYKDRQSKVTKATTFTVKGLPKDNTTQNNINEIIINNNYPEATRLNHRYRGPAESRKNDDVNFMIFSNVDTLYKLFASIEKSYNDLIEKTNNDNSIKYKSLNSVNNLTRSVDNYLHEERFSTGKYVKKED